MSDHLNSDKNGRVEKQDTPAKPYQPTLSDQHWRLFLREKSQDELEEDLNAAISAGNEWRFGILMQLEMDLSRPMEFLEAAVEHNRPEMLAALAKKSGGFGDVYIANRLAEKAAETGQLAVLHVLVGDYGVDIHKNGDEMLRAAAANGRLNVVEYLISKGADVSAWDNRPLRAACEGGHLAIAEKLVAAGADVNAGNGAPLCAAAESNSISIVTFLLDNGAKVEEGNYAVLSSAAKDDALDALKLILKNIAPQDALEKKSEALSQAVMHEHFKAAKLLIKAGANINNDNGQSLRSASWRGELETVKFLLDNGANPNVSNNRETPLSEAVAADHPDIVKALVAGGADPAYLQNVALETARQHGREGMEEAMRAGAIVAREKHRDSKAREFGAAFTGDYSLDDLRTRTSASGETGLLLAAQTGHFEDIVRAAKGGQHPHLLPSDLYHPQDRVDTVLSLLLKDDKLAQFFAPDFWASRKDALIEAHHMLPKELQEKNDLSPVVSEIHYRELLKKAHGKNGGKPPRL